MANVEALPHATKFDVQIPLDLLERDFFPGIVKRKVHLAESADADSAFDGVSRERFGSTRVRDFIQRPGNEMELLFNCIWSVVERETHNDRPPPKQGLSMCENHHIQPLRLIRRSIQP